MVPGRSNRDASAQLDRLTAYDSKGTLAFLCQIQEFVHIQSHLFEDVGECGSLDRTMCRDGELEGLGHGVFLEANVAASLPDNDPPVPLQGTGVRS